MNDIRTATKTKAVGQTDRTMMSFLEGARVLEERLESALGEVGLSVPKLAVLTHLAEAGKPLTLGEVAARLACVRSNVTQLVDRLEGDGLVKRVDDPTDRRSVRAALTALGKEKQAAGAQRMAEIQQQFSQALSDADRVALTRALAALK